MNLFIALAVGTCLGAVFALSLYVIIGKLPKKKPKRKSRGDWLTRHQLEILQSIGKHGKSGVPLWHTDINLSSMRSLSKRGYVDTRPRGRLVITSHGKRRLTQPWPPVQPTGDQKDNGGATGSNVSDIGSAASEGGTREIDG